MPGEGHFTKVKMPAGSAHATRPSGMVFVDVEDLAGFHVYVVAERIPVFGCGSGPVGHREEEVLFAPVGECRPARCRGAVWRMRRPPRRRRDRRGANAHRRYTNAVIGAMQSVGTPSRMDRSAKRSGWSGPV